nr:hypothetical protein [Pantoea rwandensis]
MPSKLAADWINGNVLAALSSSMTEVGHTVEDTSRESELSYEQVENA